MARRNQELDERLRRAAYEEFMEKGFLDASVRRIAERAGITTGALYTRYPDKDALFCSFVDVVREQIHTAFETFLPIYENAGEMADLHEFLMACDKESDWILDMMYDYYDEFILLFLKSAGSSMEEWFEDVKRKKIESSLALFHSFGFEMNELAVSMLLEQQFESYRQIVQQGMSKEKARACMKEMMQFYRRGWEGFLQVQKGAEQDEV